MTDEEAEVEKMQGLIRLFVEVAEAAVENVRRERGGQHVPYRGDFACVSPSVLSALARWARDFRAVLPREMNKAEESRPPETAATMIKEQDAVGDFERLLGVYCTCPGAARYCPIHDPATLLEMIRKRVQSSGLEDSELLAEVLRRSLTDEVIGKATPKEILAAKDEYELLDAIGADMVRSWLRDTE